MQPVIPPLPAPKTCETYAEREIRHFQTLAREAKRAERRERFRRIAGWFLP